MGTSVAARTVIRLWVVASWLTANSLWAAAGLSPGTTHARLIGEILAAVVVSGIASWTTARRIRRTQSTEMAAR